MITGIVIALVGYRIALPLAEKLAAGKPHPETWPANYSQAVDAVNAAKDN